VKSDADLENILAADTPAIWTSNRPAKGGATGAMLAKVIEKAAALKAGDGKNKKTIARQGKEPRAARKKPAVRTSGLSARTKTRR
jgi:hypothetical protein